MVKDKSVESVYVVPRERLFAGKPIPQWFHRHGLKSLVRRIYQSGKFLKRSRVENNPALKQIIPYALICFNPDRNRSQKSQYLLLRRKGTQTEKRLHHKYSLGVGGHINPVTTEEIKTGGPAAIHGLLERSELQPSIVGSPTGRLRSKSFLQLPTIIEAGLRRELTEELSITCNYSYKLVGYLNDDTNPVGQVHFGLVYQIDVPTKSKVQIAEKELMSGRFLRVAEMRQYYLLMETWSQIIYKQWLC